MPDTAPGPRPTRGSIKQMLLWQLLHKTVHRWVSVTGTGNRRVTLYTDCILTVMQWADRKEATWHLQWGLHHTANDESTRSPTSGFTFLWARRELRAPYKLTRGKPPHMYTKKRLMQSEQLRYLLPQDKQQSSMIMSFSLDLCKTYRRYTCYNKQVL